MHTPRLVHPPHVPLHIRHLPRPLDQNDRCQTGPIRSLTMQMRHCRLRHRPTSRGGTLAPFPLPSSVFRRRKCFEPWPSRRTLRRNDRRPQHRMRIHTLLVQLDTVSVVPRATGVARSTLGRVRVSDARGAGEGDGAEWNADGAFEVLEGGDGAGFTVIVRGSGPEAGEDISVTHFINTNNSSSNPCSL